MGRMIWRWGWIAMFLVAAVVAFAGPATVSPQAIVNGRPVSNLFDVLGHAKQTTTDQYGSVTVSSVPSCYFAYSSPPAVICGPIYGDTSFMEWVVFATTARPDGYGGETLTLGKASTGAVTPGMRIVGSGDIAGHINGREDDVVGTTWARHIVVSAWILGGVVLWLLALPFIYMLDRRRQDKKTRREHEEASRRWMQTGWARLAELPNAAAVTPPRPVRTIPEPRDVPQVAVLEIGPVVPTVSSGPAGEPVVSPDGAFATGEADPGEDPGREPTTRWSGPAVLMLGPVMLVGCKSEPERRVLVELAAYLCCHQDRPRSAEEIQAALWPLGGKRPELSIETLRQHLSRLRRAVGEEHLPDAGRTGYQFAGTVSSDCFRLQALAEAARSLEGDAVFKVWRDALALVRGAPFAGVPAGTYGWAWDELLVAQMEAAVTEVAHTASQGWLQAGQPRLAEWAASRGLLAVPGDETLLADRLRAAAGLGGKPALERAWRDVKMTLGDQATDGPLAGVYQRLAEGVGQAAVQPGEVTAAGQM